MTKHTVSQVKINEVLSWEASVLSLGSKENGSCQLSNTSYLFLKPKVRVTTGALAGIHFRSRTLDHDHSLTTAQSQGPTRRKLKKDSLLVIAGQVADPNMTIASTITYTPFQIDVKNSIKAIRIDGT